LLASTGLVGFARAINVHDAIVLMRGGLVAGPVWGTSAPGMDPLIVLFVFLPPLIHAAVWFLDPGFTGLCSRDRAAGRGIVSAALRSRRRVYRNCEDRLSGARPGYAQLW
jgi:hypothetical protein